MQPILGGQKGSYLTGIKNSGLLMLGETFQLLSRLYLGSRGSFEVENLRLLAGPALVLISSCLPCPTIKQCPESPRLTLNRRRKLEFVLAHHTHLPFSTVPQTDFFKQAS